MFLLEDVSKEGAAERKVGSTHLCGLRRDLLLELVLLGQLVHPHQSPRSAHGALDFLSLQLLLQGLLTPQQLFIAAFQVRNLRSHGLYDFFEGGGSQLVLHEEAFSARVGRDDLLSRPLADYHAVNNG